MRRRVVIFAVFLSVSVHETQPGPGSAAIHDAVERGDLAALKGLLTTGVTPDTTDSIAGPPLLLAAQNGHTAVVTILLEAGADPNQGSNGLIEGTTPLHLAAENGHLEVVRALLDHGARPDAEDRYRRTPVFLAEYGGHEKIVEILKEAPPVSEESSLSLYDSASSGDLETVRSRLADEPDSLNSRDPKTGKTPLHAAAEGGHAETVRVLLEAGAPVDATCFVELTPELIFRMPGFEEASDCFGKTPLHLAAKEGHLDVMRVLIDHGADPDGGGGEGPLYEAALAGHLDAARFLLESGARVQPEDPCRSQSPLAAAAKAGHSEVARFLLSKGADPRAGQDLDCCLAPPLYLAAKSGRRDMVSLLLDHGADPNAIYGGCETPLHAAARYGHAEVVQALLDRGAVLEVPAATGEFCVTPAHVAAQAGHVRVLELLLSRGVDVNVRSSEGTTPLHEAAANGRTGTVEFLLGHGADVNARAGDGMLPIHRAAAGTWPDPAWVLLALVENGSLIDATDQKGWTPLHMAAIARSASAAEILLEHGAPVDARNNDGETPLHLAAGAGFIPSATTVSLLIRAGADVNARTDDTGKTPLHMAAACGDLETVETLLAHGADPSAKDSAGVTPLDQALAGDWFLSHLCVDTIEEHGGREGAGIPEGAEDNTVLGKYFRIGEIKPPSGYFR